MSGTDDHDMNLDEELYSRQLYVIGHEAMKKMMQARVLVIGLDGLGQEIAKNICLAGIRYVDLYDKSLIQLKDLGSGFYFSKSCMGKCKDESVLPKLQSLNKYVKVSKVESVELDKYTVVVSVNQGIKYNLELNDYCHNKGIKHIIANVSGLFSQVFVDLVEHSCVDKNGEPVSSGNINDISEEGVVTLADGSKHSLEDNDSVLIDNTKYKVNVISRNQFKLLNYNKGFKFGGDFEQVKEPILLYFRSLRQCLENYDESEFLTFGNEKRIKIIHNCFCEDINNDIFNNKDLVEQFIRTRDCLIAPMCSVVGGFTAQEVLKAASQKFMPLKQFFYFDSSEAYKNKAKSVISDRYSDLRKIFGDEGVDVLQKLNIFLVGAGAIGCENLKNFVMTGMGTKGVVSVADMDSIEQSNLNRQFLFRDSDVGKMKAEAAVAQVKKLNEDFANEGLEFYNLAVNRQNENVFTDKFILKQDVLSNALDNVEARNYMDGRSIKLRRFMVDAGTLGTKGHVQVVIPFLSESYGSTRDAPENSIPMCTVKSYPNSIEHTIQWALGEFKRRFNEEVELVAEYAETGKSSNQKTEENDDANNSNPVINDDHETDEELFETAPRNVEGCIKKALALFVKLFSTNIQTLLSTFPADYITKDGIPFWAPPKRPPTPISFNINDIMHILFVETASNLYASAFNIRKITRREIYDYLENLLSLREPGPVTFENNPEVQLKDLKQLEFDKDSWHIDFIFTAANLRARNYTIKEQSRHYIKGIAGRIIPAIATTTAVVSGLATLEIIKYALSVKRNTEVDVLHAPLENGPPVKKLSMETHSYNDDSGSLKGKSCTSEQGSPDQSNSNSRSKSYVQEQTVLDQSNAIAEKNACKNAFLDLALPFLGLTDYIEPQVLTYEIGNDESKTVVKYNLWSRLEFTDCTLKEFMEKLAAKVGKKISMVSHGSHILYWDFCNKYDKNLDKMMCELCEKKPGQIIEFVDVLTEDEKEIEPVAITF